MFTMNPETPNLYTHSEYMPRFDSYRFGRDLRIGRAILRCTLRELAVETGLAFTTLARLERGNAQPSTDNLVRLIHYFGWDFSDYVVFETGGG